MPSQLLDLESELSECTREILESARTWAECNIRPLVAHHWEAGTFPYHVFDSFRNECPHLLGYTLPKKYGGQGYDLLTTSNITRVLASVDASFTTGLLVQYGLCGKSILYCGTEDQKQRLLPSLARLDHMACFCLTEPQSGSDATNVQTTATKVSGGYHISGSKRWIGNATPTTEVFVVWAKNVSLPGHPIMGFLVQKGQQANPGAITTTKIEGKVSLRMVQNSNVEFDQAFCPDSNVMHEHVGFVQSVGRVLESSRVSVSWFPVGICQGALDQVIPYVQQRLAFGAPLASNQLIQERLVRATAMVSSMFLLVQRLTRDYMEGKASVAAVSMVKAYNTKLAREVLAVCRETMGGNGIVLDFGLASKFCDIESIYTYEGSYDICALVAGRDLLGMSAIPSGAAVKRKYQAKSKL